MRLIKYLFYGLVSGFSELIPVSGLAHQQLMQYILGIEAEQPLLHLMIHIAILLSILVGCFPTLSRLHRESRYQKRHRGRRTGNRDMRSAYELRMVKTAVIPMLLLMLLYTYFSETTFDLVSLTFTCMVSGAVLIITDYMRHGNKDSRHISALDAIILGVGCALSVIPGISRVGMSLSISTARGADKTHGYNWALLLSIPAVVLFLVFDGISLFTAGVGSLSFVLLLIYFAAAAAAFAGGYAAITFINYLAVRTGFAGIGYYNLGVGIFSFILFLIT